MRCCSQLHGSTWPYRTANLDDGRLPSLARPLVRVWPAGSGAGRWLPSLGRPVSESARHKGKARDRSHGNIYPSSQIYFLHRASCCSSRDWASGNRAAGESLAAHQRAGPKPRGPTAATRPSVVFVAELRRALGRREPGSAQLLSVPLDLRALQPLASGRSGPGTAPPR